MQKVVLIASAARQGRRLPLSHVLELAAAGDPTPSGKVKEAVLTELDLVIAQLAGDLDPRMNVEDAEDARFAAAQAAVARESPGGGRSIAEFVTTGRHPDLPKPGVYRSAMRDMLQTFASDGADVSLEHIVNSAQVIGLTDSGDPYSDAAWRALGSSDLTLQGEGPAQSGWSMRSLRHRIAQEDEHDIVRALQVIMTAQAFQSVVIFWSLPAVWGHPEIVPDELAHLANRAAVQAMTSDPIWRSWGQHNSLIIVQPRQRIRSLAIAATIALLMGKIDELEAYGVRLRELLHPTRVEVIPAAR